MGLGSVKRFGARYGRSIKEKFGIIEEQQRKLYECPSCLAVKVKRQAPGIWQCRKCGLKFAGKAYTVSKKIIIREEAEKPQEQESAEDNSYAEHDKKSKSHTDESHSKKAHAEEGGETD